MRINKFLSQCNLGSRRQVEELITQGKIRVNGKICKDLSTDIDPDNDTVFYENKELNLIEDKIYIMLNKPKGYLVTSNDEYDRKTIYDLIPEFKNRLFYIGRLDLQSEGLLLLTNDGNFSNKVMQPKYKLPKTYKVTISGSINKEQIETLRNGVKIDGVMTKECKVFLKSKSTNSSVLRIVLYEGKKRQIRRMIKHIGFSVTELKRLQVGNLKLGKLPVGMWRILKPNEILDLKRSFRSGNKPETKKKK